MSNLLFACPHCWQHLSATDNKIGKERTCPSCKKKFATPAPELYFTCPACKAELSAPQTLEGKTRSCPRCKTAVIVHQDNHSLSVTISCPTCHKDIDVDASEYKQLLGQVGECPYCKSDIAFDRPKGNTPQPSMVVLKKRFSAPNTQHVSAPPTSHSVFAVTGIALAVVAVMFVGVYSIVDFTDARQHTKSLNSYPLLDQDTVSSADISETPSVPISVSASPIQPESEAQTPPALITTANTETPTAKEFVSPARITGRVHIVIKGYDLALKQVPVYLIPFSDDFKKAYNTLAAEAVPVLQEKARQQEGSSEWITAAKSLIDVEQRRAVTFRRYAATVYADNNGMFSFQDLKPGTYLVLIEGTIKDRMTIWTELINLKEGDAYSVDFGESNVGGTENIYLFAQQPQSTSTTIGDSTHDEKNVPQPQKVDPDELIDRGIKLCDGGRKAEGFSLIKQAADMGSALGQYNVGACYMDGDGVEQDTKTAAYWYTLAANQGLIVAQTKLGLCYYRGIGVSRNQQAAVKLWNQAAAQGGKDAQQLLTELSDQQDEANTDDIKLRGARKSPPDRDAAEKVLIWAGDYYVKQMLDSGQLISASRNSVVIEYVRGSGNCDAKATVGYTFTFLTQAGLQRTNPNGFIYFYHDPNRMDWFKSDMSVDGLPRY